MNGAYPRTPILTPYMPLQIHCSRFQGGHFTHTPPPPLPWCPYLYPCSQRVNHSGERNGISTQWEIALGVSGHQLDWWKITPSHPHRVQLACSRQWGSWANTWMSISANILLFGETLFCQYLHKIATDLYSVKKCPKYLTLPHLLDTHLTSTIFIFKKVDMCLPTFPLCSGWWIAKVYSANVHNTSPVLHQIIEVWID